MKLVLPLLCLAFAAPLMAMAQPRYVPNPNLTDRSFQRLVWSGGWTTRPWTADEAPYRAANAAIQAALRFACFAN